MWLIVNYERLGKPLLEMDLIKLDSLIKLDFYKNNTGLRIIFLITTLISLKFMIVNSILIVLQLEQSQR